MRSKRHSIELLIRESRDTDFAQFCVHVLAGTEKNRNADASRDRKIKDYSVCAFASRRIHYTQFSLKSQNKSLKSLPPSPLLCTTVFPLPFKVTCLGPICDAQPWPQMPGRRPSRFFARRWSSQYNFPEYDALASPEHVLNKVRK